MNATELATLSMSELKTICNRHAIEPVGDKRSKATYIRSIEIFQSQQTVIETDPSIELPQVELVPLLTPQPPTPKPQHRQASIVVVVIATMLSALLIVMGISIKTLIPVIAVVGRLSVAVWRYLVPSPTVAEPLYVAAPV